MSRPKLRRCKNFFKEGEKVRCSNFHPNERYCDEHGGENNDFKKEDNSSPLDDSYIERTLGDSYLERSFHQMGYSDEEIFDGSAHKSELANITFGQNWQIRFFFLAVVLIPILFLKIVISTTDDMSVLGWIIQNLAICMVFIVILAIIGAGIMALIAIPVSYAVEPMVKKSNKKVVREKINPLTKKDLMKLNEEQNLGTTGTKRELTEQLIENGVVNESLVMNPYLYMNKKELMELCEDMMLSPHGTKNELIERILGLEGGGKVSGWLFLRPIALIILFSIGFIILTIMGLSR